MFHRIITGTILLCVGFFTLLYGKAPLLIWLICVSNLLVYEISQLCKRKKIPVYTVLTHLCTTGIVTASTFPTVITYINTTPAALLTGLLILFFFYELLSKKVYFSSSALLNTLRLTLLCATTFVFVLGLRAGSEGLFNTCFCFISIWTFDIFALYGGKCFGRHPLSLISPNKTIEGTLIGLIGTLISNAILCHYFNYPLGIYLIFGFLTAIIGQVGDLHESLTKRFFNVKDSSDLLPGHGGFYDRADSTLFVFPFLYYGFFYFT